MAEFQLAQYAAHHKNADALLKTFGYAYQALQNRSAWEKCGLSRRQTAVLSDEFWRI
ncbi:MAG: hypothetical protein LBS77_00790 [Desulfovibrio sp.]|nr:hypothetical protein [Desulfovibrio sp.]